MSRTGGRRAVPPRSRCAVSLLLGVIMVPAGLSVGSGLASSAVSPLAPTISWLHTDGSRIVTDSGDDFTIRAVNWFGMETSNCAPHGLWQISLDQAMDQMASFGFNAIRLPFSSECLAGTAASVSGVDARLNPALLGLTPLQLMDHVVDAAAARNMRVILDRHRPDSGSQSELWYTARFSEKQWIDDWVTLATRYAGRPTVIGADLHNEPHGAACWGCGDPAVDWAAAATRAGNAVLAANPHWLVVVEGVERQQAAGSTWWGGGLADAAAHPIKLAVADQVVYSPHDYPASVFAQTWFADPTYPANLPGVWNRNWGYLQQQHIAPVLLGEFGTKLATSSDALWLRTLVGYLGTNTMSFAYWSYNPNSGDTGGLVADDWRTPQQAKLDALAPLLPGAGAPPPGSTLPPASTPATTPTPGTSRTSVTPPATSPTSTSTSTPTPTPTSTPTPSSTRTSTPAAGSTSLLTTAAPPSAAGSAMIVRWQLQSSWPDGYVAQLVATAPKAVSGGWSVSWPDPHAKSVANSWGMNCAVTAGVVSCRGASWAATIPAGGSVTVGVQMVNDGVAPVAPTLTVD